MITGAMETDSTLSDSNLKILSQTLATLVLYNTSLEDSTTFQSLSKALGITGIKMDILVYDNSSVAQTPPSSKWWTIHYLHNPSNPGVSRAYNTGIELAIKKEKKWLWLFDQDTDYPVSIFDSTVHSIKKFPGQELFVPCLNDRQGIASPLKFKHGGGQRVKKMLPGIYFLNSYFFHNCGLLISTAAFKNAGGYDEDFPLDFSDFSFVERLREVCKTFAVTSVSASHSMAATSVTSLRDREARFKQYVMSSRNFRKKYRPHNLFIPFRLFIRSIKLCLLYKSFRFISIYLHS